jgi:hypothetical protein
MPSYYFNVKLICIQYTKKIVVGRTFFGLKRNKLISKAYIDALDSSKKF